MQGSFSEESLQAALEQMAELGRHIDFVEDYLDYGGTCMKPDGTRYGIRGGTCRKGTEVSKAEAPPKRGRPAGGKNVPKAAPGEAAARMKAAYDRMVGKDLSNMGKKSPAPSIKPPENKVVAQEKPSQKAPKEEVAPKEKYGRRINERLVGALDSREIESILSKYKISERERKLLEGELQKNKKMVDNLRSRSSEDLKKLEGQLESRYMLISGLYRDYRIEYERYKKGVNPEHLEIAKRNFEKVREMSSRYYQPLKEVRGELIRRARNPGLSPEVRKKAMSDADKILEKNNVPLPKTVSRDATVSKKLIKAEVENNEKDLRTARETGKLETFNGTRPDFDFASAKDGTKLARGSYGTAIKVDGNPPTVVKVGDISTKEAAIQEKAAKAGVAGHVLKAEIDPSDQGRNAHIPIGKGRLAMEFVNGQPIGQAGNPPLEIRDKIWAQRAAMHRAGIAHNDLHVENVMWDRSNNNVRFLDFGLAQDSRRAALGEALGGLTSIHGRHTEGDFKGDRQFRRWEQFGDTPTGQRPQNMARTNDNVKNVVREMVRDGFSNEDIKFFLGGNHFRREDRYYENTAWSKMTDDQARRYTDTLYQGVS